MTATEFAMTRRSPAPPRVTDEFALELRTHSARRPPLPIRPLTGREFAVAVRYALDEGQELPLDLSAMKRIVIDPAERTARVQPGLSPAELERAAFRWGLAPLADRHGLVLANLIAAQVVLPDGELVEADAELLREIRTGRVLGIVVESTYRRHPAAELRRWLT